MRKILKSTLLIMISAILFCGFIFFNQNQINIDAYAEEETLFLGGMPIGIRAFSDNFVITDFVNVVTPTGSYSPAQKAGLKKGDVIVSVNGQNPRSYNVLIELLQQNDEVEITVQRGKEIHKTKIKTVEDTRYKGKKAGMMIKNDINGIGTVTYVKENGAFGALGHPIGDEYAHNDLYQNGTVYDCTIYGYNRAEKNKAGELIGQIDTQKPIGTFYSNSISGILGNFDEKPQKLTPINIAKREEVVPGKAYINTTIDGNIPSMYEIEIIKAENQPTENEKSMVIRITDKKLLQTTGGILQGMSGSPIIQNGKLIGAVTHVMTTDSTIGYGIYIEWMLN